MVMLMDAVSNDPFVQLTECGPELPEALARRIVLLGDDAALRLLDIAENREFLEDDRQIWARTHAVELLVELGAEATFERLIRIFISSSDSNVDDFEQWVACVDHFPRLGQPFLERVFEFLAAEPERADSVASFVARFRERDDRIDRLLDDLADRDPEGVAVILESCNNESRLPVMLRTFEKVVREPSLFLSTLGLAQVIEEFGGIIPESSRPAVARAQTAWAFQWALLCGPRCQCGSGAAFECMCGLGRRVVS